MKPLRLAALAAALVLGACSTPAPTDPAAHPSFDAGPGMVGSGNFTSETEDGGSSLGSRNGVGTGDGNLIGETEDGGNTLGSGNGVGTGGGIMTLDAGGTTTSSDTTTQRGGGMIGSGN